MIFNDKDGAAKKLGLDNASLIKNEEEMVKWINSMLEAEKVTDGQQGALIKLSKTYFPQYTSKIDEITDAYFQNKAANMEMTEVTDDAIQGLIAEGEAMGYTKSAIVDLIAKHIIFNNTNLDISSKIAALATLQSQLGITTSAAIGLNAALSGKTLDNRVQMSTALHQYGIKRSNSGYEYNGQSYKDGQTALNAAMYDEFMNSIKTESGNNTPYKSPTSGDSGSSKDPETFDWIERAVNDIEKAISRLDKQINDTYNLFSNRNNSLQQELSLVKNEIDLQYKAYDRYMQIANSVGLDSYWMNLVQYGSLDMSKISDENLAKKIQEYQEWYDKAAACSEAISELRTKEKDLYETSFSNIVKEFEGTIGLIENQSNIIESNIDKAETLNYIASTRYYEKMMYLEKSTQQELANQRDAMISSLDNAVNNGTIIPYTEAWYDLKEEISSVNEELIKSETNVAKFVNEMKQITWDRFDYVVDRFSKLTNEAEFLVDLLDGDLFTDSGELNDKGKATIGLRGLNYNTYMEQSIAYSNELQKIEEELAKNPSDTKLLERKYELIDARQEMILAAQNEKDAISDLVNDGIDAELDALKELIDTYTEALESQKELYDYQKNVADQTKEIASLQKQLAAYAGDNSEEAKAKVQQLKVSLEEAENALEETQYDKYISDQSELLDDLYEKYEETLNERLDDVDALIDESIDAINDNATNISKTLTTEASKVGITLSNEMKSIWNSGNQVLTNYLNGKFGGIVLKSDGYLSNLSELSGLQEVLSIICSDLNAMVSSASNRALYGTDVDSYRDKMKTNSLNWWVADESNKGKFSDANQTLGKDAGLNYHDGNWYDEQGRLFYTVSDDEKIRAIVSAMKTNSDMWHISNKSVQSDLEAKNIRLANQIQTISGQPVYKDVTGIWYIGNKELYSYKSGAYNIPSDRNAWTQEHGQEVIIRPSDGAILTPLVRNDSILNADATKNLFDLSNNPVDFISKHLKSQGISDIPVIKSGGNTYQNDVGIDIILPNVKNYEDFKYALQHDSQFEKIVQAMTIDRLSGANILKKFKS